MIVPLTGIVSLAVGYICVLLLYLWGDSFKPLTLEDRLSRATLLYVPPAALIFGAMALGQAADPDVFMVKLLFKDNVFFWINPAIGVAISAIVYYILPLRELLLSWVCYVFYRDKVRTDITLGTLSISFAITAFLLAFLVNLNIDFPLTEAEYERRLDWQT